MRGVVKIVQIVDAFWEERNLGVTCCEVTVEDNDSVQVVEMSLKSLKSSYQVVKLPVARYDLMQLLERSGFSFIECSMNVVHRLNNFQLDGIRKRINDSIYYSEMDNDDIGILYDELARGVFITDRIYLDPMFSKDQSAHRYINWLKDEVGRGGQLYKVVYKDETIGFFIFKETNGGGCYPFLSGLYSSATTPGLGNSLLHKIIEESLRRGMKYISSYISSNNMPVVKLHISEGFSIISINYVYVKHHLGSGLL